MQRIVLLAVAASLFCVVGFGEDSPQSRGPDRTGVFPEKGLMKEWPKDGPPFAWVTKGIGRGFSSASVADGKIYVTGMMEPQQGCFFILDLNGNVLQKIEYGQETLEKQAPGTRSTPTIEGDRAYLLSGLGVVYCIDLAKNAVAWNVDLCKTFEAKHPVWDFAESLLIDGDRVICTPGGNDAAVVMLDKQTGATLQVTKGLTDTASYCTPIIVDHNGRRLLLDATSKFFLGIDAANGNLLWKHAHKAPWDIHAVTPVYSNGLVFITAGDDVEGGALEVSADAASVNFKWTNNSLSCLHHGVVLVDGYLYGSGQKQLVCLEMATGKMMWSTKEVREGSLVAADGMLYVYEGPKTGVLNLVKAQPTAFERTGSIKILEGDGQHWAHPTIANGRLYIRHGDALIAYDILANRRFRS